MKPLACFQIIIFFFSVVKAETTMIAVDNNVEAVSEEKVCHLAPSEKDAERYALTVATCSPLILAAGASTLKKAAPLTAAALAKATGKLGGRLVAGANIVGGALTAFELFKLFGAGAASIERCRLHEIEFKKYIIQQFNDRGERYRVALEKAGFNLSERDKRRLQFPPAYSEPERLQKMLCGELVLLAERMKERHNRVYADYVNGTMKIVPIPIEEKRKLTESEFSMIDEFRKSLKCLPTEEYIKGVCAIGNFILFARPLPKKVKPREQSEDMGGLKDKGVASSNFQNKPVSIAADVVRERRKSGLEVEVGSHQIRSIYGSRNVRRVRIGGTPDDPHAKLDYDLSEKDGDTVLDVIMVKADHDRLSGERGMAQWLLAEALVGSENSVDVICGSLDQTNKAAYNNNLNKGMSKEDAALNTPAGKSRRRLGFTKISSRSTLLFQSATLCMEKP